MIEQGFTLMGEVLVLLTRCASLNVFRYPFPHFRQPVGSIHGLEGGISSRVSCHWVVVILC